MVSKYTLNGKEYKYNEDVLDFLSHFLYDFVLPKKFADVITPADLYSMRHPYGLGIKEIDYPQRLIDKFPKGYEALQPLSFQHRRKYAEKVLSENRRDFTRQRINFGNRFTYHYRFLGR